MTKSLEKNRLGESYLSGILMVQCSLMLWLEDWTCSLL